MIGGNHAHPLSSLLPPPKSQSLFLSFPSPFPYLPPPTKFCFVLLLTSPPVQSSPILPPRRIQRQQNTREFLVCFSVSYSPLSSFPLYSPLSSFPLYSPLSPFNHHLTPPCPQKPKKKTNAPNPTGSGKTNTPPKIPSLCQLSFSIPAHPHHLALTLSNTFTNDPLFSRWKKGEGRVGKRGECVQ